MTPAEMHTVLSIVLPCTPVDITPLPLAIRADLRDGTIIVYIPARDWWIVCRGLTHRGSADNLERALELCE